MQSSHHSPNDGLLGLVLAAQSAPANGPAIQSGPNVRCGTFQFGDRRVQVHSSLPDIGRAYFSRFRHRALDDAVDAEVLEFSGGPCCYRLTFQGEVIADVSSLTELIGRAHELFLSWEHPNTGFLAYFHAAAVSRGGHSVLLPGVSGAGKSTLTAYLAGHGFAYVADDLVAMARPQIWFLADSDGPLPTAPTPSNAAVSWT